MSEVSVSTNISGIELKSCLYNASGPLCTTVEHLNDLGLSHSAAILSKSSTLKEHKGNPSPRYFENELGSINSMGLPNKGYLYYDSLASSLLKYEKPYFVSVSGFSLEENLCIIKKLNENKEVTAIELNLSCPNVPGKPQTGYDFQQVKLVLEEVFKINKKILGVKLPPYFDLIHFYSMADILNEYPLSFVTCINSIGNGLVIDVETESVVIKPKNGFGGIGGDYIKPTALANVRKFRELLKKEISVIGCGGIKTGMDAFEHILCGADAVQIGTQFMREGINCFERIESELKELMQSKGYKTLNEFKGNIKLIH